jgi:hypothetical protein
MTDDPDTRRARLDRLAALARHANPEGRARQAAAQARQQAEQAALEDAAEANLARWESELTALLMKLYISRGHIPE